MPEHPAGRADADRNHWLLRSPTLSQVLCARQVSGVVVDE